MLIGGEQITKVEGADALQRGITQEVSRPMLKLVRVQILGFKSFCDRTDVTLTGRGIAAVVGPNGCGKSNISDAITWVLGEQSAKSLRGVKMEDVIFAGTRERKPTGMAEVSLTLVDPEVYDGAVLHPDGPELVIADRHPAEDAPTLEDWDEEQLRASTAAETEAAVAEAQPGVVLSEATADGALRPTPNAEAAEGAEAPTPGQGERHTDAPAGETLTDDVVLRIRRRRFSRAPVRAGEVTVTRRLFRSGDSEYLLNGRICRLRDIQDIFLGTGLGGESYAIIGQERIGQLLSSKPLERRGIIEEAAGITRFKTKKRLAELRLESAKQNLARVNDIFDEVTRQMASLKRQAAKAERYGAMRDDLRGKLRVVLHSRMALLDAEAQTVAAGIARDTEAIDTRAGEIEALDTAHTSGVARGYELDGAIRAASATASQTAVDLERLTTRAASNRERVVELSARLESGTGELEAGRAHLAELTAELEQQRRFLEGANAESASARDAAMRQAAEAQGAVRAVQTAEQQLEQSRRNILQLLQKAGGIRNEITQAETALGSLEAEAERLGRESETAREELAALGQQRGQIKLTYESVTERLQRLEAEIATLRLDVEDRRRRESEGKRQGDALRSELASLNGRRQSLEGLIRDHSYSTDTVKTIFRSAKRQAHANGSAAPLGTLADFLELETQFGAIVDEFLRDELNFVVVQSWEAADQCVQLLRSEVNGRATILFQSDGGEVATPGVQRPVSPVQADGLTPLREVVRVSSELSLPLHELLPKLRDGYLAADLPQARALAEQHPEAWFLAPTGEVFHARTVTAGRASASGPLALKRDLKELLTKVQAAETKLAAAEQTTASLAHEIADAQTAMERKTQERREAEREAANSGAALRQMESEAQRLNRRLQDWQLGTERNRDQRNAKTDLIARRRTETEAADREHAALEQSLSELQGKLAKHREDRDRLQAAAAAASAALAGLDERRRNAQGGFDQTTRVLSGQTARLTQLEAQLASAAAERTRREDETLGLDAEQTSLRETHAHAVAEGARLAAEAAELRRGLAETDVRLRSARAEAESLREQRAQLSSRAARLAAEIEHIDEQCRNDLNIEPEMLRQETAISPLDGEALQEQEAETRAIKGRLEAMGPVNMMALEEFHEAAERHGFLETQRRDLMDSIGNTQASIREIDDVSKVKFDEAFKIINENFSVTFTKLFGGGQALMKLTDEENAAESGIDIVASPPGKKLQSILLLSGGEKALTALSLLVGIFQFQPAPFCILDEVDAPLDETNVGRFAKLIADMSSTTQFIVITHSKRTMEQADVIFGVTMQEPGVSKVVSVNLATGKEGSRRRAVA